MDIIFSKYQSYALSFFFFVSRSNLDPRSVPPSLILELVNAVAVTEVQYQWLIC